ncbi:uncharacterized protein TRIREDRAFT_68427 [Trichoderma reesei QM6a]|jgi:hypothetical protein|uniref:Predicted protein n=2 Tax=Hypocrea jecorina TaxID=51453 RepID=G0RU15_HYPJQ|nr:uncharacterized protein TRIREDRAFT_68427 [Trichoderma reesei QM6a]EGR45369.1 predicted protein [Trichoderma reesei QM6a]
MCQTTDNSSSPERATLSAAARAQVPNHPAAQEALRIALNSLSPSLFNHSLRLYIYAQAILNSSSAGLPGSYEAFKGVSLEPHVLFVACIYHDLSTIEKYDNNPKRFEIVAADEAVALLLRHGESEAVAREAWLAMSLHTTPGIPENLGGAVQALRLGIKTEFRGYNLEERVLSGEQWRIVREDLPRLDIEKDLSDAVVRQALATEEKAPRMSWAGELLKWKKANPDYQGANQAF